MSLQSILNATFDFKHKENCAEGVIQNIFEIIHQEKRNKPFIFDFLLSQLTLSSRKCFTVREFEELYIDSLKKVLKCSYTKPVSFNNFIVSQIFFITFELLRITSFRLTPENYEKLTDLFRNQLSSFFTDNFNTNRFEDYILGIKTSKEILSYFNIGISFFSAGFFLTYFLLK